jgi:hypothetical protein
MAAVLLTLGMFALIAGALVVLARFWPRSSRRTGYRISGRDSAPGETPPVPEDDDTRWDWRDRHP